MAWKAYEVLSVVPTFDPSPIQGLGLMSRNTLDKGQAQTFHSWDGDTGLAFRFTYKTRSPAEWANLREFFSRQKGAGKSFYLPTWQPDIVIDSAATAGDTQIIVEDAGFSALAEDRPDTEKRIIFTLTSSLSFQANRVVNASDNGDGTETLTLEDALVHDLDPALDMAGLVYLSRFAEDTHSFTASLPGWGSVNSRFLTVRNTRRVDDEQLVTSLAVGNALAFTDLVATDNDPLPYDLRVSYALGPLVYSASQATPYFEDWKATASGSSVSLERTDGSSTPFNSTLYDSVFETDHLRHCFDAVSREVLAWKISETQFRIGHFVGGVETRLNVTGYSPVCFNTWPIDSSAATAGDAEVIVYYLKKGFPNIYARIKSDSFAVEYLAIQSPSSPLYLHQVVKNGSYLEIQGMDVGHRRASWRALYNPPIRPEASEFALSLTDGGLQLVAIEAVPDADGAGFDMALEDGYYRPIIQTVSPDADGAGFDMALEDGAFLDVVVKAPDNSEASEFSLELQSGSYTLTAKQGNASDDSSFALNLESGDYSQP